ncbi:MAG: Poly-beta-hydroxybutyrate polymerase [Alphaproteobacteria bacterium ADurb.BinA280]|jgi:polyhydroxyalkanoate synthase subunit PhaC|nr:class III poly(R)-hydroxyalkanoic acid synthase subunit PhaC [Xanthomonadales bacterium]MCC6505439.1 class III poly(R)-hydroxyalkanoic acid synthase subunit PhaC [Aquimonas sp.]OPZ12020.1 MAG: Poly-beta-hydroxybutyrate polymerase [Alphaproteobacteria bacterium ADurb.BinA280]
MFGPVGISPSQWTQEWLTTQRQLRNGAQVLAQVGEVEFGVTPKEAVFSDERVTLYRYKGEHTPTEQVPILISYALVNRPYMVDLQADRSLVRQLLARGHDIYLIDWGYPDLSDRFDTLDDYINGWLHVCVEEVCRRHGLPAINLLGICQGGAFSLCYTAMHPERVRNLITMVTPVDFHTPDNMLSHWTREMDIDLFVDTLGNIPADLMNFCYLTLKPYRLFLQKYVGMLDVVEDADEVESFMRMEKWIFDSPDQAGEAFRQFIRDFYQGNKLVRGGLQIGRHEVDLSRVRCPVLNIYAEQDHLVPPAASKAMAKAVGSRDYSELSFRGGHIGIYVSSRAQKEVPDAVDAWLAKR